MTNERAKDVLDTFLEELKKKLPEKTSENTTVIVALEVAISALEKIPKYRKKYKRWKRKALELMPEEVEYVPMQDAKGISCTECKYFKVLNEPYRTTGVLWDFGRVCCEKHDLIKDFSNEGQFKNLKPCAYYEDFKERDKHDR